MRDTAPQFGKCALGSLTPTLGETADKDSRIDRRCTRCADAFENDALVLEQAVEDTPGEGAMGSSSLERKIDPFEIGRVTGTGSRERLVLIATGDAASGSPLGCPRSPSRIYRPPRQDQRSVRAIAGSQTLKRDTLFRQDGLNF